MSQDVGMFFAIWRKIDEVRQANVFFARAVKVEDYWSNLEQKLRTLTSEFGSLQSIFKDIFVDEDKWDEHSKIEL